LYIGLNIGQGTAANALHELRDHYRVYRSCETDAVRGPAVSAIRSRRAKCHATAWKSVES